MGVAAAAHRRPWSADAGIGSGVRHRIRWPASSGRPGSRERATYVPGRGRCERPRGRWHSRSEPGCGASSRVARSSLADRIRGEEKIFCCVTTRGRNFGVLNGFRRDFSSPPAHLFGLGMPRFDTRVLAMFRLAVRRLPAADVPQAFRVLAVALVPAPRLVLASASFAQADPRARSPRSRQTAVALRTVKGAHGSGNSQGKSSGRMLVAFSSGVIKTRIRRFLASLSLSREQDRELDSLIDALRTRTPSAAVQTIVFPRTRRRDTRDHPTGSEQGPRALPFKRSPAREQDREINGLIDGRGTRTPSAAIQTIACSRTRQRNKRSHRRAGNKNPERCSPND